MIIIGNCRSLAYIIQMNEESLHENSIIYMSAGFQGPFVLQAFSVRKCTPPAVGLQMCLTDGRVYIGAKYNSSECPEVQDYWLLQVTAKFISQTQPIMIKTLQVHSTYPRKLLGAPPCTLIDHFNKEINKHGQDRLGDPSKKIKYSNPLGLPLLKNSDNKKPAQKEKGPNSFTTLSPNVYKKKEEYHPKLQGDRKPSEKKLKIADSDEEEDEGTFIMKKQTGKRTPTPTVQIDGDSQNILKNSLISDLYERRAGWVLLCRVNYINKVECANGLFANNFMLSDEEGDEIKCVYFENPLDDEKDKLETGKYYSFSDGEISRGSKNDGARELQITFDKNSTIVPRTNIQFDLNLSKVSRIGSIVSRDPNCEINVIGIIKSIKFMEQISKSKLKYSATICDPLSNHQIDLLLFLNNNEKPPIKGAIGILHNFQLYKQNNILRLNSTYRSYFREENKFKDSLTSELQRVKNEREWENIFYKNLSSVAFSYRSVQDLKDIFKSTDDERIYSLIDCWAMDISRKKLYNACKSCKKVTQKKDTGIYYCPSCKKQIQTLLCYTLTVHFADYTSSVVVDVIGEHAQTLLEMKAGQFNDLSPDKQLEHLDYLRYKNVTIKLKTEKKGDKKEIHSVWAIEQSQACSTIKEIKKRLNDSKVKLDDKW